MIMSLQDSNQPGSHWIALKRVNNTIFAFDSFGMGIYPWILLRYIKTIK